MRPIRGPETAAEGEPSAPGSVGFSLAFEGGAALLRLAERELDAGVLIRAADFEIPNVRFPLDVTGGADWFQNRRLRLRAIELTLDLEAVRDRLRDIWSQNSLLLRRLTTENGVIVIEGTVGAREDQHFVAHAAIGTVRGLTVRLQLFDTVVFGAAAMTPSVLAHTLAAALPVGEARPEMAQARFFDVGELLVQPLLVQAGWKKAALGDVEIEWIHVGENRLTLVACGSERPGWLPDRPVQPASAAFTRGVRAMARSDAANALAQAIADGQPDRAGKLAQALTDRFPDSDSTVALAAEALLLDPRSCDEALELLQTARGRRDIQVLANLGRALADPGARSEVLAELAAAAERTGQERLAQRAAVEQGHAEASRQDELRARVAFERALTFDDRDADALRGAFEACLGLGQTADALRYGERALRAREDDCDLAVRVGYLHLDLGDLERARRAFRRALHARPRTDALLGLAQIAQATGDPARAAALYQEACATARGSGDYAGLAQGLGALAKFAVDVLSDPATALAAVEELIERGAEDGVSALAGARAAEALGDEHRARALLERALRLVAGGVERANAHFRLGMLLQRCGDEDAAEFHLRAAAEQGSPGAAGEPEDEFFDRARQAWIELRAHRGEPEALAELHKREAERAVLPEARGIALLHYAHARDALGDVRGALLALIDAIAVHPTLVGVTDAAQQFLERCDRQALADLVPRAAALASSRARQNLLLLIAQRCQACAAVDCAAEAIRRSLQDGDSLVVLEAWIDLARAQGDREGLVDALGRLAALDSDRHGTDALLERARLYAGPLARPQDAVADFKAALARGAPDGVALALADAALASGDQAVAIDTLRPLLGSSESDLRRRASRRLFELALQRDDEALVLESAPVLEAAGDAEATTALDRLLERRGEHATLIERYAGRDTPEQRLRAAELALVHSTDIERTLALLREVSARFPETVEAVAQLIARLPDTVPPAHRELALTFAQGLSLPPEQQRSLLRQRLALLEGPLTDGARAAAVRE
ncbi:MAG: tetratricopeptide repeat protein, partial [Deltaproteobacteria bacterium]|nr:tetratricopeptide repeat protein [Deltaproteobacteria bacterium]